MFFLFQGYAISTATVHFTITAHSSTGNFLHATIYPTSTRTLLHRRRRRRRRQRRCRCGRVQTQTDICIIFPTTSGKQLEFTHASIFYWTPRAVNILPICNTVTWLMYKFLLMKLGSKYTLQLCISLFETSFIIFTALRYVLEQWSTQTTE